MIKKPINKLHASARLRFPDDASKRATYITQHLDASTRHDTAHYWMTPEAWRDLKARIVAEHGERPRLNSRRAGKPKPHPHHLLPPHHRG